MKVSFSHKGDFKKTDVFLDKMSKGDLFRHLNGLAEKGVAALAAATPTDSGETAASWYCEVKVGRRFTSISWRNRHTDGGFPVAIMLQYGHATGTGGWVQGRDYINPTIKPIFDQIADEAWKLVISA
jgi:hypothetical protein